MMLCLKWFIFEKLKNNFAVKVDV